MKKVKLEDILLYEQPSKYIVYSTKYNDSYETPVLTAGKTFLLGYTDETDGIYTKLPCIIFDDFTTATKFVNFPFKVKSSAMKILTAANEDINLKYFFYMMKTIQIDNQTHKRFWISEYSKIKVKYPSLPEQNRIVKKLDELFSELDKGIEELNEAKRKLKVYKQSVLKDVFDSIDNMESITEAFAITGGLTKNSKRNSLELKMPYLRVGNVYYNHLDLSEIKMIGVTEQEIGRTLLHKSDLLFVEGNGSKEQIGRVAIWDNSIKDCLHQNHIIKGRPNGKVTSKFALYYLMSKNGRLQILKVASSTSGLYTLSINKIKSINIPYCSLDEQKNIIEKIESRLSICDQIENTIDENLYKAEQLRQSILKQAFDGRLV